MNNNYFLISQSGNLVRPGALKTDWCKVKSYYLEWIVCKIGYSVLFISLFIYGGSLLSHMIVSLGTKFCMMFIKVSLKIETCLATSLIRCALSQSNRSMLYGRDQHSLCCSTILLFHKVEDNRWINQNKPIPTDDDNSSEERVEHLR